MEEVVRIELFTIDDTRFASSKDSSDEMGKHNIREAIDSEIGMLTSFT